MERARINCFYLATEGEGVFIGTPQIFVRFQGCNIGCLNCDSMETWDFKSGGENYTVNDLLFEVVTLSHASKIKRVSITGGDPLHQSHLPFLRKFIDQLKKNNFVINIEASGVRVVEDIFSSVDFISFDYKTPSTGVETKLEHIEKLILEYPEKFQIKSVVETKEDFQKALRVKNELDSKYPLVYSWCLTPSYKSNEEFPMERFQQVIEWNHTQGAPFRVIGQQHKWIYGSDRRKV